MYVGSMNGCYGYDGISIGCLGREKPIIFLFGLIGKCLDRISRSVAGKKGMDMY